MSDEVYELGNPEEGALRIDTTMNKLPDGAAINEQLHLMHFSGCLKPKSLVDVVPHPGFIIAGIHIES